MTEPILTPQLKGTALEVAINAIETMILRESPSYNEKTFSFEMRKIMTVGGVRHEIDIWVSVDIGDGYTALFISECKNWADKVGKNEIVVFSEKIDAVKAQRGFFFARSFTEDAVAQAAKDPRITLRLVTDLPTTNLDGIPTKLHGVAIEGLDVMVHFLGLGATADRYDVREQVDVTSTLTVCGRETTAKEYVDDWALGERNKRVNAFPSQGAEEGVHELEFEAERRFGAGEVMVNGKNAEGARLVGKVRVRVTKARIISYFEVATRGRALTVAVDVAGSQIIAAFVTGVPRQR